MENAPRKVLIVDDDQDLREVLSLECGLRGLVPVQAASVDEAVALLEQGDIDWVISDYMMPERNGLELIQWMRKHPSFTAMPVILLTASSDISLVTAFHHGVDALVVKPFVRDDFFQTFWLLHQRQKDRWTNDPGLGDSALWLQQSHHSLQEVMARDALQFGRGGFFLALNHWEGGAYQMVNFHLHFNSGELAEFAGAGMVRWQRPARGHGDLIPGVGLEIIYLESPARQWLEQYLRLHGPQSFIPEGSRKVRAA